MSSVERFFGVTRQFQDGGLTVGQARKAATDRILGTAVLKVCFLNPKP